MDELDLSTLLTDVIFTPGVTEIEAKFKPKNINLFIDRYKLLLEKMRDDYDEVIEESIVNFYDNKGEKIRETIIDGNATYDSKTLIKNFDDYAEYGVLISINEEKKLTTTNVKKLKPTYVRNRYRHKFNIANKYMLDMTEITTKKGIIYEIELEFIGKRVNLGQFAKQIMYFYQFIYNTEYMYNAEMTKRLVEQTNAIIGSHIEITKTPYIYSLTPKARNLNFADLTFGSIVGNNMTDYYVGHKADGLYKKLVFNEDGIWLNNKDDYSLISLGEYDLSLYDCEVVYNNNNNEGTKYYVLVFDCLIHNNKFLYEMELPKRTKYIKNIIVEEDNLTIIEKEWKPLTLDNFFSTMIAMVEEAENLSYPQDGFMFMFGKKYNFGSDKLPLFRRKMDKYPDLCKWKPYTQLTIDFRVVNDNGYVTLYVYDPKVKNEVPYLVPSLSPTLYEEQYNGYVVECIYDSICNMVSPVKIRYDKQGPNEMDIARSNWNNIIDPISTDDLCGRSLTLVRKYQNQIKNILYGIKTIYPPLDLQLPKGYSLLDIGGGRGGDLSKWQKSGVSNVVTIEPDNDNLAELQKRLAKSSLKGKVTAINTIGEDTARITKEIAKIMPTKADVVSLMLSLSFFFSDEEHLNALVQTIVHNIKQKGIVLFLTIDGKKLKDDMSFPDLNVYYSMVGGVFVLAEIPGIVGKQWEFLVDLDKLTKKLLVFGIEIGQQRPATDELLLSPEGMAYSSLFSYGYYKKVKNVVPKNVTIKLPKIVYPTMKSELLSLLKDDVVVPMKNLLYGGMVRIGTIGSLEHAILKAVYEPYQNDAKERTSIESEFKLSTTKDINITKRENDYLDHLSNLLNVDIYVLVLAGDDVVLKYNTYRCIVRTSVVLFLNENKYELIGLDVNDLLKTNFGGDDPFIYQIKKLITTNDKPIINNNINTLINNMKKVLVLPNKGTNAYNELRDKLTGVLENNDLANYTKIIKSYKLLPETNNDYRINERVKSIDDMLKEVGFNMQNMKVLDIGAGNGDIISAIKVHYQLPKKNVYAIDQKLPELNDVTALTYDENGRVPLADNSVNVILLYAVLHHVEPTLRIGLMKEVQRVLAPGGIVIIREHDDDKTTAFYQYIDFIHVLWYITKNETDDPLYMLNRQEFTEMFKANGLESIYYTTYDEPNAQHIYHEIFRKPIKKADTIIEFAQELIKEYNASSVLDMFGIDGLRDNVDVDYYGYFTGKRYKTAENIHLTRGNLIDADLPDSYDLVLGEFVVNGEDDWFDNLIDSMVKVWENLRRSGHLIIITNNTKKYTFTDKMVKIFTKITPTATFEGENDNFTKHAFVFKKVAFVDTTLLDVEVSRYDTINKMLLRAYEGLERNQQYEIKNILERWLLTLANDKTPGDILFTQSKLKDSYPATKKMYQELQDKKVPNFRKVYIDMLNYAKEWLNLTIYPKSKLPVIIDKNTVKINDYVRELPPGKLDILLTINDDLVLLGRMIMRYACMLIGGQQWALPTELHKYMVDNYKVTIEGFASPINSQILFVANEVGLNFCSLFPDTDAIYGSLGSFFDYDFTNKHVYANPPYVDSLMNMVADKVIASCTNAKKKKEYVRFFITVPEWADAEYYHKLKTSPYKVYDHMFHKNKHYYLDTNKGLTPVVSKFNTHLFVLAVNVKDDYDKFITYADKVYSTQTRK